MSIKYSYRGKLLNGEEIKGNMIADNREEALANLKNRKIYVSELRTNEGLLNEGKWLSKFTSPISYNDLICFTKQLATMLRTGVPVVEALETVILNTNNSRLKFTIVSIKEQIKSGKTLYEAFAKHTDIFSQFMIGLIQAGEQSGNLDLVLEKISDHYYREYKIVKKIKNSLTYPLLLTGVSILVIYILLTTVLPRFVAIFSNRDIELPQITNLILSLGDVFNSIENLVLIGLSSFAVTLIVYYFLIKTDKLDRYKLAIPIIGKVIKTFEIIKFTRTLSMLLQSGISLLQSLQIVILVVKNKQYKLAIQRIISDLNYGKSIEKCIYQNDLFYPMVSKMIVIGENSGQLESILAELADYYEREINDSLDNISSLIEPVMILIMSVIIGVIVLSVVLPMINIWQVF